MGNEDLVDRIHEELNQTDLHYCGMRRVNSRLYLVYDDMRIDSEKLYTILNKYRKMLDIDIEMLPDVDELREYGFNSGNIGKEKWEELSHIAEIIKISPKSTES